MSASTVTAVSAIRQSPIPLARFPELMEITPHLAACDEPKTDPDRTSGVMGCNLDVRMPPQPTGAAKKVLGLGPEAYCGGPSGRGFGW